MLYSAKCYWPAVTPGEQEDAADTAHALIAQKPSGRPVYRGSLLFPGDELVLCLFEASSPTAVRRASDGAGIPCERVMDTVWVPPDGCRRTVCLSVPVGEPPTPERP
ncbi:MAG: hypothetical protein QOC86_220 [Gaiellales bacterium]|nr:hypothetical protein [Gaiellales bacterium]